LAIERVDEFFFQKRNRNIYELYKLGFESKFTFEEQNNPQFNFDKKIPEDDNYTSLINLIYARDTSSTDNIFESFGKFLDIEQYIKYHAATSIMNNSDGFTNNFFLVKENPEAPFYIIPWDFDKCFSHPYDASLVGDNAIIRKLFESDTTFNLYKAEMQFQINSVFTESNLFPIIDSLKSVIKDAYNLDPYLGNGRYNFDHEINRLKEYITQRITFVKENIDSLPR
jgi:spore coat protein H